MTCRPAKQVTFDLAEDKEHKEALDDVTLAQLSLHNKAEGVQGRLSCMLSITSGSMSLSLAPCACTCCLCRFSRSYSTDWASSLLPTCLDVCLYMVKAKVSRISPPHLAASTHHLMTKHCVSFPSLYLRITTSFSMGTHKFVVWLAHMAQGIAACASLHRAMRAARQAWRFCETSSASRAHVRRRW